MDTENIYGMRFSDKRQYGLIAQDVQNVLPELVKELNRPATIDDHGITIYPEVNYKGIVYDQLFALMLKGMQEQQAQIEALTNTLEQCCNSSGDRIGMRPANNTINVELSSVNSIILNQNDPNPFAGQTRISYNIPDEINKAEIIFSDNNGRVVKSVIINERGNGVLQVYASNLSKGVYTYSLIADGQLIDTKKMVCSK